MKKRICLVLSILAVVLCIFGLSGCAKDKVFEKAGMQITLTSSFYEKEMV